MTKTTTTYGDLHDYTTGEYIRPATKAEREASDAEVDRGHAEGLIEVDGRTCYVEAGREELRRAKDNDDRETKRLRS